MKLNLLVLLTFVLKVFAPADAVADSVAWVSQASGSTLAFSAWYDGEELLGAFGDFRVRLILDEGGSNPTDLEVEVRMGSADMNDREINAELSEAEWFDSASFPLAAYTSNAIRAAPSGYLASGQLRLKDSTQALDIPLHWEAGDGQVSLSGSVILSRQAWRIGTGEWAGDTRLEDRVEVRYEVTLIPEQ